MTATLTAPTLIEIAEEKARRHLRGFMDLRWTRIDENGSPICELVPGRHIDYVCDILEEVERWVRERTFPAGALVVIEEPPRHSKTEKVGRSFPPWVLARNPDWDLIYATYGQDLSNDISRAARDSGREFWPRLWGLEVSSESSSVKRWEVAGHRGGFTAVGMGGPITGRGAHIFIIDDPIKNAEEAMSEVTRKAQWDWFESVADTRMAPGGITILMATRWHSDDLIGRAIERAEETGQKIIRVRLPLLAEEDDILEREPGEALWPERGFDKGWALERKERMSPWVFAALYQQRPVPDEGGMFARQDLRYYSESDGSLALFGREQTPLDQATHFDKTDTSCFIKVDLATSLKEMADYTVVSVFRSTRYGDLLIEDVHRQRIEGPDQADLVEAIWRQSGASSVGVERMGYQLALIQELTRRGVPVVGIDPKGDKRERAIPASIRTKNHKVFIRKDAPWRKDFEDELLSFPLGEHDDQVDTLAYAALDPVPLEGRRGFRGGRGNRREDR